MQAAVPQLLPPPPHPLIYSLLAMRPDLDGLPEPAMVLVAQTPRDTREEGGRMQPRPSGLIKPLRSVQKKPRGTCWTPAVPVPVTVPSNAPESEVCKGEGSETCTEVTDANQRAQMPIS